MSISGIDSSASSALMTSLSNDSSKVVKGKDSDGDGALTIEESGISEEAFDNIDADGDDLVTREELLTKIKKTIVEMKEKLGELFTDDSQTSDIDGIKQMLAEIKLPSQENEESSETDSASGTDLYTRILKKLGISDDEIKSFFDIIANNSTSSKA